MLIIKGDSDKYGIGHTLVQNCNAFCIAYGDYCPPYAKHHINDTNSEIFLEYFLRISEHIYKYVHYDYEYLIIYTNQNEEDLKDIIDWFNKHIIPFKDIILICK